MPAYNAEKTIKASINSVLAQTYENWELIVINDASRDLTLNEIPPDPRIIVLTNEKNSGIAKSRNLGISHAKGDMLAFLDSDDIWHADKLAGQLDFMEKTGAAISYTATAYMNAEGKMYGYVLRAEKKLRYKDLLKRNLMSCSSVMVRRCVMLPFPETGEMHEDYAVWLAIVRKIGCAYGLDEPLLIYRIARGSKSGKRISSAMMIFRSYRQVGYMSFQAGLLTLRYALHSIAKRVSIKLLRV